MRCIISVLALLMVLNIGALAMGPAGDYGDAPVGDMADNIEAYPGTISRFVSYYIHTNTIILPQYDYGTYVNSGATFHLGTIAPSVKIDSEQNPSSPENDCYPLVQLAGTYALPGPNPLATIAFDVTTTAAHDPSLPIYLNVFIDQNRDGQWKDGYLEGLEVYSWDMEWVMQDVAVYQNADRTVMHTFSDIRVAMPTQDVWIRVIATDQPVGTMYRPHPTDGTGFWDVTMPSGHSAVGEIEDFLMKYYSNPSNMPNTGTRPWGMVLLRRIPPGGGGPKPECFLRFRKISYARELGDIRRFVVKTPWCQDGVVEFGLAFKYISFAGGCDNADALVALYGHKLIRGRGLPPSILRTPLGGANLGAPPLPCAPPPGTLPAAHPDDPANYPRVDEGITPVADWVNGPLFWDACYLDPPRYRLYGSKVIALSCGSAIMNHAITPGPDEPTNPSEGDYIEGSVPGKTRNIYWEAGDLIEKFVDLGEPVEFPDPDFVDYEFILHGQTSFAGLEETLFFSPPYSLGLDDAEYIVSPNIPPFNRAIQVDFNHTGTGGTAILWSSEGDSFDTSIPALSGPGSLSIPIPEDFILVTIQIDLSYGQIDDLTVVLGPYSQYPTFLDDCNNNEVVDEIDIDEGYSSDANGNWIPDECDGYEPEYVCGDANADGIVNVSDAVWIINYVFVGGDPPLPLEAGDANCDDICNVSDAVWIINYVFVGGNEPCDTDGDGLPDC